MPDLTPDQRHRRSAKTKRWQTLGRFKDNPSLLATAIRYLKEVN